MTHPVREVVLISPRPNTCPDCRRPLGVIDEYPGTPGSSVCALCVACGYSSCNVGRLEEAS